MVGVCFCVLEIWGIRLCIRSKFSPLPSVDKVLQQNIEGFIVIYFLWCISFLSYFETIFAHKMQTCLAGSLSAMWLMLSNGDIGVNVGLVTFG